MFRTDASAVFTLKCGVQKAKATAYLKNGTRRSTSFFGACVAESFVIFGLVYHFCRPALGSLEHSMRAQMTLLIRERVQDSYGLENSTKNAPEVVFALIPGQKRD